MMAAGFRMKAQLLRRNLIALFQVVVVVVLLIMEEVLKGTTELGDLSDV